MRKRTRENQPALADASNKTEHQSDGLTQSQRLALEHVAASARAAHSAAQASLQARLRSLGIDEEELVQRSSLLLAYVRSEAPLIVYVPYDVVTLLLSDPFLRSQFETMRSRGTLSAGTRMGWERAMFGGHYDSAPAAERPKYGCLNICASPLGVPSASRYGDVYITLHRSVRSRVSVTLGDSGGCHANKGAIGTLEHFGHLLVQSSNVELQAMLAAIDGKEHGPISTVYKELQIHGTVSIAEHVSEIALPSTDRERMAPLAERFQERFQGVAVRWF